LENLHNIYFLGIGGIGMSALARYFKGKGVNVCGYDKTPTKLTKQLQIEGIDVHFEDNINKIPDKIDLVIYTPAVPRDLNEFRHLEQSGIPLKKRAEVLGALTKDKKTIAVAGTHGKTTVSALTAHLLTHSGIGCTAFMGGISKNYQTNLLTCDESDWMVVEADEYDKSFLQLHPNTGIITSTDADHLDIYKNIGNLRTTFEQYVSNIKSNGYLIIKIGVRLNLDDLSDIKIFYYSANHRADFYADHLRLEKGKYIFDFITPQKTIKDVISGLPGEINVENAVAAMTAAYLASVPEDYLKSGMATFIGMERRFDVQVKTDKIIYIDDYAHHPEEIRATVSSIKKMYQGKKVLGIFQPHLFSRTKDFADEFAQSLDLLDEVILLPIYPARENPIEGVNSAMLLSRIQKKNKSMCSKEDILQEISSKDFDLLVTLGAGDIDQLVNPIKNYLLKTREG
jgi:UDP-N-acetylmuramate--alanine ligase